MEMDTRAQVSAMFVAKRLQERLHQSPPDAAESGFCRSAVLAVLLGTANPITACGPAVLRPLWAEEAMDRSITILRLVLMLEERSRSGLGTPLDAAQELATANAIAACFRALDRLQETHRLPCSETLEGIVSGLGRLFGSIAGEVEVTTHLMPLMLPAYKRRSLVLAASNLMTQAILHAFGRRGGGRIEIALQPVGRHQVHFLIEDDGNWPEGPRPTGGYDIVAGLADLLETDVVYRRAQLGGTATEFVFPL